MRVPFRVALLSLCLAGVPAFGAADDLIEQLATCRVSWLDWKNDPVQGGKFAETITGAFVQKPRSPAWTPRKPILLGGLPVVEAFPESVGMGVGFSVTVDAPFDKARDVFEKLAGKTFKTCETGEGMRSCELKIADKRTLVILGGESAKSKTTLLGCYYFYAK